MHHRRVKKVADHDLGLGKGVEELLEEFNRQLQEGRTPSPEAFVRRCSEGDRRELRSLLNTLRLADRALEPLRQALTEAVAEKD